MKDGKPPESTVTPETAGPKGEAAEQAAEAKIRAEWAGGRLLRGLERRQGERTDLTSSTDGQSPYREALEAAGISRQDANRWQK